MNLEEKKEKRRPFIRTPFNVVLKAIVLFIGQSLLALLLLLLLLFTLMKS
jgi:hypothetical protein